MTKHNCKDARWPLALMSYAIVQGYNHPTKDGPGEVNYYCIENQSEMFKIDYCPFCAAKL